MTKGLVSWLTDSSHHPLIEAVTLIMGSAINVVYIWKKLLVNTFEMN